MLSDHKNNSGWLAVGLGLGAITGILFAPKAGCETRRAIAAAIDDGIEHLATFERTTRACVTSVKAFLTRRNRGNADNDAATKASKEAA
jgi:gas vesicle protein